MSLENKIVDYKDNVLDIEHWVALKGEFRYESIINFLTENKIECNWANVTYYIKYDKRILINSFKYIVFLEEMYKSFVFKKRHNPNIQSSAFRIAYNSFLSLGDDAVFDDIDLSLMKKNEAAINTFRNCVVHNRILLNRKYGGLSLEEVLNVIIKILPTSYRNGFIKDINDCSKGLLNSHWNIKL